MSLDAAGSMTRTTPDMLAEAARAVENGWMIFPVAGKVPRTRRGVLDATRCYETIDGWHRRGVKMIAPAYLRELPAGIERPDRETLPW